MKKNLKNLLFLLLLSFLFFTAGAQEKNYGILTMKKEDIQKYYENNVENIVFKYRKPLFASYKLRGTPFDSAAAPVLQPFKLRKVKRHDKQKLQNLYKGVLILYVEDMKYHGIDGSFDIYFYPMLDPLKLNYVSYLINNTPDKVEKKSTGIVTTLQSHTASGPLDSPAKPVFSSFQLNPSPPYRAGER